MNDFTYTKQQIEGILLNAFQIRESASIDRPDDESLIGVWDVELAAKKCLKPREVEFVRLLMSGEHYLSVCSEMEFDSIKTFYNWKEKVVIKIYKRLNGVDNNE